VFYDASSAWEETPALHLEWVQASASSWHSAAQMISQRLGDVASTQKVLAIDAHNSSPTAAARFVAFFDVHQAAPPGRIAFVHQNATYRWDQFYRRAVDAAYFGVQTISTTGSNNENGKAVMFVWYYEGVEKPVLPVPPLTKTLSVMSFNVWCNGGESLSRTCEVIRHSNPDVVGLQECSIETARILALKLRMYYAGNKGSQPVLSRWPIEPLDVEVCNTGFKILPPNAREIAMYNVHLAAYPYAPYELHHHHKSAVIVEEIEHKTQFPKLSPVLRAMRPRMAETQIVLLTGDFNAASHIDYPAGPIFPCSTACAALGLVDSFDDARTRGVTGGRANTWSSKAAQEPHGIHDRIDFVYYSRTGGLKVEESRHLDESNSGVPEYPSDHRAVLTIFEVLDCAEPVESC
jgi:endonuclease/exonuclease/phosphatase family metal-dependent hydrolase